MKTTEVITVSVDWDLLVPEDCDFSVYAGLITEFIDGLSGCEVTEWETKDDEGTSDQDKS